MNARKCFAILTTLILAGCASKTLLQPDCHSCTVEDQSWKDFSWNTLEGKWRGEVESWKNERNSKNKARNTVAAELQFMSGEQFLQARGANECAALPKGSLVLNGLFWGGMPGAKEFEAFVPAEEGKVAYGRLSFERMNGKDFCQFRRYGRVMGKNRLSLPAVSFSDSVLPGGRVIASAPNTEKEISVEFLRFVQPQVAADFPKGSRRPAAAAEAERPSLMIRVFQVQTLNNKSRGEWSSTEEQIYRLWRAN